MSQAGAQVATTQSPAMPYSALFMSWSREITVRHFGAVLRFNRFSGFADETVVVPGTVPPPAEHQEVTVEHHSDGKCHSKTVHKENDQGESTTVWRWLACRIRSLRPSLAHATRSRRASRGGLCHFVLAAGHCCAPSGSSVCRCGRTLDVFGKRDVSRPRPLPCAL
jgi:hypothetical protein